MKIKYACTYGDEKGVRCRNFVDWPETRCEDHRDSNQTLPAPDIVKVNFTFSPSWSKKFQRIGIPRREPRERREQVQWIEQHAQTYGKEPYAYRSDFPASGTLVLYTFREEVPKEENLKAGLRNVFLMNLIEELAEEPFFLGKIYIQSREKRLDQLILPFYREEVPIQEAAPDEKVEMLFDQIVRSWNVHVYVNPPRPSDGKVVHTVNAHGKERGLRLTLHFNHGLWAVEELE